MIHSLLSHVFHVAARLIVTVLFWIALFPVAVVIATPLILLLSALDKIPYLAAVQDRYSRFYAWWMDAIPSVSVDWS